MYDSCAVVVQISQKSLVGQCVKLILSACSASNWRSMRIYVICIVSAVNITQYKCMTGAPSRKMLSSVKEYMDATRLHDTNTAVVNISLISVEELINHSGTSLQLQPEPFCHDAMIVVEIGLPDSVAVSCRARQALIDCERYHASVAKHHVCIDRPVCQRIAFACRQCAPAGSLHNVFEGTG